MLTEPDEFIPTRRSLLSRLKDWDDQESWRDFFDTYWRLIYSVALKTGLTDAEAQDVVQETILAVAKKMRGFRYDPALGSFKSWLLLITRRRIADQLRRQYRDPARARPADPGQTGTDLLARVPDPAAADIDAIWEDEWQHNIFNAALERVRGEVDPKQFQLFDCYVLKQWPVQDVTRTLGVSPGQVYLAKNRVSARIKKEIKRLQRAMV
jgi:RNA polymerase sigma-70 factor (ECF subfamily)